MIKWLHEEVEISKLKVYDKNPRKVTAKGRRELKESLSNIGMTEVIVVDNDYTILSGHQRFDILKANNTKTVSIHKASEPLNEEQRQEVVIRMNKTVAGEFDLDVLAKEFDRERLLEQGFGEEELLDKAEVEVEQINDQYNDSNCEMPIIPEFDEKYDSITIMCETGREFIHLKNLLGLTEKHKSYKTSSIGQCRGIKYKDFIDKLKENQDKL